MGKAGKAGSGLLDRHNLGRLSSPILVGRERELELLLEASVSPPALILVEGEAGLGKSRLVHETVSDSAIQRRRVLVGTCHRLSEPFLMGPVVEALRGAASEPPSRPLSPVVGVLQPLLPELADFLPPEPPSVGDPRAERHRVFRALRELIGAFGPTVCVLEDLHWADEGTLEFLAFLLSQPPQELALVLTYRGEDLPASSRLLGLAARLPTEMLNVTIELSPLRVEEVRRLICAILETEEVSDELVKHLHERTAGIPFALEEVIRLLRDREQLTVTEAGQTVADLQQIDVPPAIRQSIKERMQLLTADARLVARAAAVLAVPASEDLIAGVAGLPPQRTLRGLAKALSSALLQDQGKGSYGFRHALAAQAVYDEIPTPERRRLHQRAGEALESDQALAHTQLAHHFKEADRPKQWARYSEAAAEDAGSVGDARAAARLLEQALSAPGLSEAARVRMAIRLGSTARHSDCPERAIHLLQQVLDGNPTPVGVRGELRFRLSQLRYCVGEGGLWYEEMVRAVGELRRRPGLAARSMGQLAWPMLREGDVEDDLTWLDRAVQAAEQSGDPVTKTGIRATRAAVLLCVGDPAGWSALENLPSEGRSLDEKLELLRGYHSLSGVVRGLGYYRRAEGFLAEVARINKELDHVWWGPWRESARVSIDWCVGRWEGLEPRARRLAESGTGTATLAVGSELVLGSLLLARGDVEDAEATFQSILQESRRRGWLGARVAASAWLARIRLSQGNAQAARQVAALGLDVVRHKRIWIWGREVIPAAVQAFLGCGQPVEARELAGRFAAGIRGKDAPAALAASYFCQGTVAEAEGSYRAAADFLETAERRWTDLPCPYEVAKSREARARCLLAQDDDGGADLLVSALDGFEDLGAGWDATRTRAALRAHDLPLPSRSRGGRRGYGEELSPREAEVARLAGSGRKNREIAEALFISPRTVEAHVASAIRKLGIESRQELASVAGGEAQPKST